MTGRGPWIFLSFHRSGFVWATGCVVATLYGSLPQADAPQSLSLCGIPVGLGGYSCPCPLARPQDTISSTAAAGRVRALAGHSRLSSEMTLSMASYLFLLTTVVTLACRIIYYRIPCRDSRTLKLYDVLHNYLLSTFPYKEERHITLL